MMAAKRGASKSNFAPKRKLNRAELQAIGRFTLREGPENLEAARVRDRARPRHEAVQSAEFPDHLGTGTQKQVVSIRQHDLGVQLGGQVALHHAFHRGLRADGHEDGRLDNSMRGVDQAGAGASVGALGFEFDNALFHCKQEEPDLLAAHGQGGEEPE